MLFVSSSSRVLPDGSVTAHGVEDFSTPGVETIGGIRIKRIAPGEAIGSHDLEWWSSPRSVGLSKSYATRDERKKLKQWTKPATTTQAPSHDGAAARGILVEKSAYARGWFVSWPNGKTNGPFRREADAWDYVQRQSSRRYGR
jgi:hypothetical protein